VPQRLQTFRESVVAALDAERRQVVTARWTEGAFPYRAFRHDYAFYAKKASGNALTTASPAALWTVLTAIGGDNRYYTMDLLWWLREFADWLVGGPGFTHGRRHPTDVRLGDAIDYWTVIGLERERRLTLNFGMRAPGAGILEFEIEPCDDGRSRLTVTAYWHPQGAWGLLYWYTLVPAHLFVFDRMTDAMARRAEALPAGSAAAPSR
jgi:hypothetical protein